jgi:hypothetical protein
MKKEKYLKLLNDNLQTIENEIENRTKNNIEKNLKKNIKRKFII